MYRYFLSWRYLLTRRTNWIGVGGIFVAVAALILILSIMSGFLDQSKAMLRGDLSDLAVTPMQGIGGREQDSDPARDSALVLESIGKDDRVVGASPRLLWYGQAGGDTRQMRLLMQSSLGDFSAIQLVGVEVRTPYLLAESAAAPVLAALGLPPESTAGRPHGRWVDEFSTTDLFDALDRKPLLGFKVQEPLLPFLRPKHYRTDGRPATAVVLGDQLMARLDVRRGDELQITTIIPGEGEVPATANRRFVVAGSFRTGANSIDGERIYLPRADLEDLLGGLQEYSEILVATKDYDLYGKALKADLTQRLFEEGLLAGYPDETGTLVPARGQVRTWEDYRSNLIGAIENERVLMAIMLSLILLVSGFTLFSILTMMVTEKRRDIGILASVGATPRGILATFLLIGLWNAVLGTGFGVAAGILGARYINDIELWLSDLLGVTIFNREVYYFDEIPANVHLSSVLWIAGGAFFSTLLFAAIPAWRASRVDPLVALRHQ
ncbi:MAG: FtsX-like permease family protein [Planctomycetota bacterium]